MIQKTDLEKCRETIEANIGRKVRLTSNGGRKRIIVREGTVESCFPNVFTVNCPRNGRRNELISYSYVDVLTAAVEITPMGVPLAN